MTSGEVLILTGSFRALQGFGVVPAMERYRARPPGRVRAPAREVGAYVRVVPDALTVKIKERRLTNVSIVRAPGTHEPEMVGLG